MTESYFALADKWADRSSTVTTWGFICTGVALVLIWLIYRKR